MIVQTAQVTLRIDMYRSEHRMQMAYIQVQQVQRQQHLHHL